MKAVADRIIIEPFEAENKIGGMEIMEKKRAPRKGKIVASGPDCKTAKEGDTAFFVKSPGVEVSLDNKEYIIMRESDLLAIL